LHSCDDKIPHLFSLVKRFYVDFCIFVKITPTFFVVICRAAFARNAFACQPLEISFGIFLKPRRRASDLQPPPRANRALKKQQPLQIAPPQNGFNALQNFFGKMHAIVCLFFLRLL